MGVSGTPPIPLSSGSITRRWAVLGLIFLGILISYLDRENLSLAAEPIMREFRLPQSSMGLLLSAFFWTYALFQIPAGFMVDRFGIRPTYAAAFLIWSAASAGMAVSRNSADIFSLRLVLGLAETVGPVASLAFIRHAFTGREQTVPISIYMSGQTLGPACGALLGSLLLANFGWRAMFATTGLVALLWVPAWMSFAPNPHRQRPATEECIGVGSATVRATLGIAVWSPTFWAMCGCVFFFSYYWYFVLTWMPAYLTIARGFSTWAMGRTLSVPLFTMAATNLIAGWVADRLIKRTGAVFRVRVWFAGVGLGGAAFVLLLDVLPGRAAVLPILVVSICSFGIVSANYWAIVQFAPPAAMTGRTVGLLNTLSQIGGGAAPLVTGWSLGPQKNFEFAIFLAGISPLISCLLLLIANPRALARLKTHLSGVPRRPLPLTVAAPDAH